MGSRRRMLAAACFHWLMHAPLLLLRACRAGCSAHLHRLSAARSAGAPSHLLLLRQRHVEAVGKIARPSEEGERNEVGGQERAEAAVPVIRFLQVSFIMETTLA